MDYSPHDVITALMSFLDFVLYSFLIIQNNETSHVHLIYVSKTSHVYAKAIYLLYSLSETLYSMI